MFEKITNFFANAQAALLKRKSKNTDASATLSNIDEEAIKKQFRERFLKDLTVFVGRDMQDQSGSLMGSYVYSLPVMIPMLGVLLLTGAGAPVAFACAAALALGRSFIVSPLVQTAYQDAIPKLDQAEFSQSMEKWLSDHIKDLPDYLDQLDRREEDLRKRKKLLALIEKNGDAVVLKKEDQELLRRYDNKKFKTRGENPFPLKAHQALLGNWHYTQLARAIREDIKRQSTLKKIFENNFK